MSNSTRQGGYDERLVVPLEASRRGAHRARVNPLTSALPVLAVVVVVVAVIGVAYTLFVRGSNSTDDTATGTVPTTSAPAARTSAPSTTAPAGGSPTSASPSTSNSPAVQVSKSTAFVIYNGSTPPVSGLGAKALDAMKAKSWTGAKLIRGPAPVKVSTTRVYHASPAERPTAQAIAKALGVGAAKLNTSIAANGIVLVVGNDYAA